MSIKFGPKYALVEPKKQRIKSKSHHVGSQIYGVKYVHYTVYNGMGRYFELAVSKVRGNSGQSNFGQSEPW